MEKTQRLIKKILTSSQDVKIGKLAYELLSAVRSERNVESLEPLLLHKNNVVVESAVWIASELGGASGPVVNLLANLLNHEVDNVRYFAVEAVTASSSILSSGQLAMLVELIGDESAAVRWKVMNALVILTKEQIGTAGNELLVRPGHEAMGKALVWLGSRNSEILSEIFATIECDSSSTRRCGVVALARLQDVIKRKLIDISRQDQADIKDFAIEYVATSEIAK